ncbi:unnamed protein product [Cladocopium goreaui]|uniref:Uncharacterized protein n=1 Tax=Cladocopium goreaui TaxID=2562237 RepID=A0A9P1G5Z9_9DINO|nr:unnamed protein product [Cladocopium goreaui]
MPWPWWDCHVSRIFLNSATHGRTRRRPYGFENKWAYVKQANQITVRTIIVLMLCACRAVYWFVEQPGSSKLPLFPELKLLRRLMRASGMKTYFTRFWMAHWGAPSPKLSMAISSAPYVKELKKKLTKADRAKLSSDGIAIVRTLPNGKKTVSGGPKLRSTQVYPKGFARKLYQLHKKLKAKKGFEHKAAVNMAYKHHAKVKKAFGDELKAKKEEGMSDRAKAALAAAKLRTAAVLQSMSQPQKEADAVKEMMSREAELEEREAQEGGDVKEAAESEDMEDGNWKNHNWYDQQSYHDSQHSDYWRHWNSPAWSYGGYGNSWNGSQHYGYSAYDGYGSPGDSFQTPPAKRSFGRADSFASLGSSECSEKSLRRASTVDQLDAETKGNIETALGFIPDGPQKDALLAWMAPPCSVFSFSEPCSPESIVGRNVAPGNQPMAKKALSKDLDSVSTQTGQKNKEAPKEEALNAPSTTPTPDEASNEAPSTAPKQPETNTTRDDKQADDEKIERSPADAESKDENKKSKTQEAKSAPETAAQEQKTEKPTADAKLEAAAEPKNNTDKTAPAVANETKPAASNAAEAPPAAAAGSAPPKQPETNTTRDDKQADKKVETPPADAENKDEDEKDKTKEATSAPEATAQEQKTQKPTADAKLEAAAEPKSNTDKTAPAVANETKPAASNAADAPPEAAAPLKQPERSTAPDVKQADDEKIATPAQAADTQDSQEDSEKTKEDAISQKLAKATSIQGKLAAMAAAKISQEKEEQEKAAASAAAKRKANEAQLKDLKPTSKAAAKAKEDSQGEKRKAEDAPHDAEEKPKAARVAEGQDEAPAHSDDEDEETKRLEEKKKKARATYMRFYRSMRGKYAPKEVKSMCQKASGRKDLMSVLYEDWHEAGEDWTKAKIYLQVTSKEKQQRYGVREWLTRAQMEQKFGMEGAEAIILRKLEDEKLRKTEVRMHPEAPTCEGLMQFLTLNMEKEVDSTETCVNRLYEAAEQADSDSSSSNSDDEVAPKKKAAPAPKKKKEKKAKKEKKTKPAKEESEDENAKLLKELLKKAKKAWPCNAWLSIKVLGL